MILSAFSPEVSNDSRSDGNVRILFSTGSIKHLPLEEVFELAREAGFDGCDLVIGREFNDSNYRCKVLDCLAILPIGSLHAPYTHVAAFGDEVQALRSSVELAREFGSQVVTFHPPSWFTRQFDYSRWFRHVKDFQLELGCEGIALAVENMPLRRLILPTYVLNNFRRLMDFGVKRNLYFTYDITHMGSSGHDIVDGLLLYLGTGRLRNVHVSDYSLWRERSHLGLGRGELPIVRLLNTMRRLEYDSYVTLELAPQELPRTREWLSKVVSYACSYLKLHLGREETAGLRIDA
jgi:sugar phosphate isomerase/epimerase